jgi:2-aminoadipate transaminase
MRMDALSNALDDLKRRSVRAKYIYTIPTVQNPTGTIMPEARRAELLKLSEAHGVPVFEDDCYADLIWDGSRPPAIYAMSRSGGVVHIGSFSKSIAPALRVGSLAGTSFRARCQSRPMPVPARLSRWCSRNIARRTSPRTLPS